MRRIFKLSAVVLLLALLGCATTAVESRATGASSRELRLLMTQQQLLQSALSSCDENDLKHDAMGLLTAHFDVELGAVAPGDAEHVGFQHLVSSIHSLPCLLCVVYAYS